MWRKTSRWAVIVAGFLLLAWGGFAMWTGWDVIQVERGWSLFIGGAAAMAGGAVTMALALVLERLDLLLAVKIGAEAAPDRKKTRSAPAPDRLDALASAPAPAASGPVEAPQPARLRELGVAAQTSTAKAEPKAEPYEVDRYESGSTTYVMFSDGSVEVRDLAGSRRYGSLAEVRPQTP